MKAGILAAGEGSRLRSEGLDLPKPLIKVAGIPLIERLITTFIRNGITEIAIIVNEDSLSVKDFIERRNFGIPIAIVVKSTPSSMHSLFALAPYLEGSEHFVLSTVDAIYREEEFTQYVNYIQKAKSADGILAITDFIDDEKPLYVEFDESTRTIGSFSRGTLTRWVTGGIYSFSPVIFHEIDVMLERKVERLRNFLGHLIEQQYRVEGFPFSKIIDVDHVGDIATAEKWLRQLQTESALQH